MQEPRNCGTNPASDKRAIHHEAIIELLVLNAAISLLRPMIFGIADGSCLAIDVIEAPMRVSAYPRSELAGTAGLTFLDAKWEVCKNQN